jgi:hypothetical protein
MNILPMSSHVLCQLPQKVSNVYTLMPSNTYDEFRVLLATIKYLGRNPCPQCLVQKADIALVGTNADTATRNHHQTDNDTRRQNIERARKHIFTEGLGVKSSTVKKILKAHSIVPTQVSSISIRIPNRVTLLPECVLRQDDVGRTRLPPTLCHGFAP